VLHDELLDVGEQLSPDAVPPVVRAHAEPDARGVRVLADRQDDVCGAHDPPGVVHGREGDPRQGRCTVRHAHLRQRGPLVHTGSPDRLVGVEVDVEPLLGQHLAVGVEQVERAATW